MSKLTQEQREIISTQLEVIIAYFDDSHQSVWDANDSDIEESELFYAAYDAVVELRDKINP